MKILMLAVLISLPGFAYADQFYNDYVYKCVKDGKVSYQEQPCGTSIKGSKDDYTQSVVPMADFCKDKTISEQNALKKGCVHFYLPNEGK